MEKYLNDIQKQKMNKFKNTEMKETWTWSLRRYQLYFHVYVYYQVWQHWENPTKTLWLTLRVYISLENLLENRFYS